MIEDLGFESYVCPRQAITPYSWMLLDTYRHYQKGFLPRAGGVDDQPHHLMQAIRLIEGRVAENDKDRKDKHASKATR